MLLRPKENQDCVIDLVSDQSPLQAEDRDKEGTTPEGVVTRKE
jgi:hypothetical protein